MSNGASAAAGDAARVLRGGDGLAGLHALLRARQFSAGPGELLAATRLVAQLDAAGRLPHAAALESRLRAVYCKSADEQRRFGAVFADWLRQFEALRSEERGEASRTSVQQVLAVKPDWNERISRWAGIAVVVAIAMWYGIQEYRKPAEEPKQAPPVVEGKQADGPAKSAGRATGPGAGTVAPTVAANAEFIPLTRRQRELEPWVAGVLLALPLLALAVLYAPALVLGQGQGRRGRGGARVRLDVSAWRKEAERVVPALDARTAARLDRHMWLPRDAETFGVRRLIDPERTLRETMRQGGRFTLRFRPQRVRPSYLVLLDVRDENDVRGRMFYRWAERLRRQGVAVDIWLFDQDPRTLYRPDARRVRGDRHGAVALAHLAARKSGIERLVIVSDGASFAHADGTLAQWWREIGWARWRQRVMFTPIDPRDWGKRELAIEHALARGDPGFLVLPLEQEALQAYSIELTAGTLPPIVLAAARRYPPSLAALPQQGRSVTPPPAADVERLIAELRLYLGDNGLRWLAACAVPPLVRWELTLLLGEALFRALGVGSGQSRREEEKTLRWLMATNYSRLARLPWLRGLRSAAAADGASPQPGDGSASQTERPQRHDAASPHGRMSARPATATAMPADTQPDSAAAAGTNDGPFIPDWLRLRLLHELPETVQAQIRAIVERLLDRLPVKEAEARGDVQEFAFAPPRALNEKAYAGKPAGVDTATQWLYLGFMDGLSPRQLQLRAPRQWRERIGARLALPRTEGWARWIGSFLRALWARIVWRDSAVTGEIAWRPLFMVMAAVIAGVFALDRLARAPAGEIWPWLESALLEEREFGVGAAHGGPVNAAEFAPDGRYFATASSDFTARVWDGRSGQPTSRTMRHTAKVRQALFNADGTLIATAGDEDFVRVWDGASGKQVHAIRFPEGGPLTIAVEPIRSLLAVRMRGGTTPIAPVVRLFDFATGSEQGALNRPNEPPVVLSQTDCTFSPDGRHLLVTNGAAATLFELESGSNPAIGRTITHNGPITFAAFSPDSRWLITTSEDRTARLTPLAAPVAKQAQARGRLERTVDLRPQEPGAVRAQWRAQPVQQSAPPFAQTRPEADRMRHTAAVVHAAFSPDSRLVATASVDGTVAVWDVEERRIVSDYPAHRAPVRRVAFHPSGDLIASAADDGRVLIWAPRDGTPRGAPLVHGAAVTTLAFDPDGTQLLTASSDATARVWRLDSGPSTAAPPAPLRGKRDDAIVWLIVLALAAVASTAWATFADTRFGAALRRLAARGTAGA